VTPTGQQPAWCGKNVVSSMPDEPPEALEDCV